MDLWLLRLVFHINSLDEYEFIIQESRLYKLIENAQNLPKYTKTYKGINYNEKIEKKLFVSEKEIKNSSYYPELNIRKSKKYKLEATSSW